MSSYDRRTVLRAGAGAVSLSAAGTGAIGSAAAHGDPRPPPEEPNEYETMVVQTVSVGGMLGILAAVFWAIHTSGDGT